MKKQDNLTTKKILTIVLAVAVIGFLVCVGIIVAYVMKTNRENAHYEEMQETYTVAEEAATEEPEEYVCPVDFEKLKKEENEDIYAWIRIPDTKIDYPIVQHPEDDNYYLTHTIDGTYGFPGAIYTELYNQKNFQDTMTVIYGHNMKDGTMFRDLYKFMDKEFFDTHEDFSIYLPEREIKYKVLAAWQTNDQRILVWNDFSDKEMFQYQLEILQEKEDTQTNHVRKDLEVSGYDRYVILETCIDDEPKQRYIVVAKEIEE